MQPNLECKKEKIFRICSIRSKSFETESKSVDSDNLITISLNNAGLSKCLEQESNYDNTEKAKYSNPTIKSAVDVSLLSYNLIKAIKSVKSTVKYLNREKRDLNQIESIRIEWREAARRIDSVLFLASGLTVFSTPIFLFSAYFYEKPFLINESCNCNL
jgi:hypothetical protein